MNIFTLIGLTMLVAVLNYFLMRAVHKYETMTLGMLFMSWIPFLNIMLAVALTLSLISHENKENAFMNKILGGEGERYK